MDEGLSTDEVLRELDDLVVAHQGGGPVLAKVNRFKDAVRARYRVLEETRTDLPCTGLPLERVLQALEDEVWLSEVERPDKIARAYTVAAVRDHVIHARREAASSN